MHLLQTGNVEGVIAAHKRCDYNDLLQTENVEGVIAAAHKRFDYNDLLQTENIEGVIAAAHKRCDFNDLLQTGNVEGAIAAAHRRCDYNGPLQAENIEGGGNVMKQDLNCMIVQDLLPKYIEKLTSDITNRAVEEHISTCEQCSELLNIMSAEKTSQNTATERGLRFLKKVKPARLIAAVSCILLALILSYMLYASEYKFTNDKVALSTAITEYTSHGRHNVADAYVLETKEIAGVLIAFFKDNKNSDVHGFARLLKGVNMKYRLVEASYGSSGYTVIVDTYRFDTNKGVYYAVGGHNLDKNIASYGLKLYDENRSDYSGDMLKFNTENSQFLDIKKESDLQESITEFKGNLVFFGHGSAALLDAEGKDITESYKMPDIINTWGAGTGTAELFMIYVFIAIVLILGATFARYFLSGK